jgi:uncharacterized membrane protein
MSQFLVPSWWFSFAGDVWLWWLMCVVLGLLAWPLTVRIFASLTDAGAGLANGIGVIATTWMAWVLAHPYGGKLLIFRVLYIGMGAALLAVYRRRRATAPREHGLAVAGGLLVFLGLIHLPHGAPSIAFCALLLGAVSAYAAWSQEDHGRALFRRSVVPFVAAQLVFTAGFLFFVNVRTYIPWATFDLALWQAEKAGNLMHLNNAMRAVTMPPGDAWFLGEPENYYYGGHVMIAALAKLSGTPARVAFNLGLATVFGLALAMGFSLGYSMAVPAIPPARRGSLWHRGLAWGLVGALAVAVFGNLDAWRQLGKRNPEDVKHALEAQTTGAEYALSAPHLFDLRAQTARLRKLTLEELRWSPENLKTVDFWASSRAIHGAPPTERDAMTITEFPYFTALLGDLHPNHTSMPFTLAALAACLALLRLMLAAPATNEADWLARGAGPLCAMAWLMGAVLPVSTWDSIVLSVLYLLTIARSRRGLVADERWRWALYAALAAGISWVAAFAINFKASVPVFALAPAYALALAVAVAGPWMLPTFAAWPAAQARLRTLVAAVALVALAGLVAGLRAEVGATAALAAAVRDGCILFMAVGVAAWLALRRQDDATWWTSAVATTGIVGGTAVVVALPFLLTFQSPLSGHLLVKAIPPIPSPTVVTGQADLVSRIWAALPINPFPKELRSELLDEMAHWGIFAIPLAGYLLVLLVRAAIKRPKTMAGWILGAAALCAVTLLALDGYWAGALGLTLSAIAVLLATMPRTPNDDVPILIFAATGFFWFWFVEALHFDDSYGGMLERYNTPFKIFCPCWPMMAVATVAALRRLSPPARLSSLPGWTVLKSLGFLVTAVLVGLVGYYGLGPQRALLPVGIGLGVALAAATLVHVVHQLAGWIGRPRAKAAAPPDEALRVSEPGQAVSMAAAAGGAPSSTATPTEAAAPQVPAAETPRPAPRPAVLTEAPALAPALLLCALGLLYPFAATAVRTHSFFSEPLEGTYMDDPNGERTRDFYTKRTLDALAWYGQTKRYALDLPAIDWLLANGRSGAIILESPGEGAYTPEGRVSSMTGIPTLVGWKHHEAQWRGWEGYPAPPYLQKRYFDDLQDLLPGLGLPISRADELALYRASLESTAALQQRLRQAIPGASPRAIDEAATNVVEARNRGINNYAFIDRLNTRMGDIYRAPALDAQVWSWLRLYNIHYVFVGSLEREHFGATLGKFDTFLQRFTNGSATIYEVPAAP